MTRGSSSSSSSSSGRSRELALRGAVFLEHAVFFVVACRTLNIFRRKGFAGVYSATFKALRNLPGVEILIQSLVRREVEGAVRRLAKSDSQITREAHRPMLRLPLEGISGEEILQQLDALKAAERRSTETGHKSLGYVSYNPEAGTQLSAHCQLLLEAFRAFGERSGVDLSGEHDRVVEMAFAAFLSESTNPNNPALVPVIRKVGWFGWFGGGEGWRRRRRVLVCDRVVEMMFVAFLSESMNMSNPALVPVIRKVDWFGWFGGGGWWGDGMVEKEKRVCSLRRNVEVRSLDFLGTGKFYGVYFGALRSLTHPSLPPSPPSLQCENEVIAMTASLLHGDEEVVGSLTSGTSESILLTVKTYRDMARANLPHILEPEMILPLTAHPAFVKAGHLFGVRVVTVAVGPDKRVSLEAVEAALTANTILLVASAPQAPHGVIDPIPCLADMARELNVPLHIDAR